jgi:hypothetical protein
LNIKGGHRKLLHEKQNRFCVPKALNAQARRKSDVTRFVEATIETKAKKRRNQEAPASSAWKST